MKTIIVSVPARGLAKRPLYELRDVDGRVVLTCENWPTAQRWQRNLEKEN